MFLRFRIVVIATMMVIVCIPTVTVAQPFVGWGVKLGLTSAFQTQVNEAFTYDYPSRIGLNAGIYAEWLDHPWFSVNSEVYFGQKGHKLDIPVTTAQFPDGTGEIIRESIRLDYLSVAILPKARLSIGPVELYALAGPRVDFSLGHSVTVEGKEPIRTILLAGWNSNLRHYVDAQVGGTLQWDALAMRCCRWVLVLKSDTVPTSLHLPNFQIPPQRIILGNSCCWLPSRIRDSDILDGPLCDSRQVVGRL